MRKVGYFFAIAQRVQYIAAKANNPNTAKSVKPNAYRIRNENSLNDVRNHPCL